MFLVFKLFNFDFNDVCIVIVIVCDLVFFVLFNNDIDKIIISKYIYF